MVVTRWLTALSFWFFTSLFVYDCYAEVVLPLFADVDKVAAAAALASFVDVVDVVTAKLFVTSFVVFALLLLLLLLLCNAALCCISYTITSPLFVNSTIQSRNGQSAEV